MKDFFEPYILRLAKLGTKQREKMISDFISSLFYELKELYNKSEPSENSWIHKVDNFELAFFDDAAELVFYERKQDFPTSYKNNYPAIARPSKLLWQKDGVLHNDEGPAFMHSKKIIYAKDGKYYIPSYILKIIKPEKRKKLSKALLANENKENIYNVLKWI